MADKRIMELTEVTEVSSDQNLALDSSAGTRRITLANFLDTTLEESGKPADSKTVGDALAEKVDAVEGKGLSTEDFTSAEKTKLSGIEAEANKTVIDDTLSNAGEAADAKAVGDEIANEVTARNAAISAAISDEVTARNAAIAANIDATLAVSGKSADAKATGDAIAGEATARNAAITANVDNTLSVSGKAADAKKTGDEIADLKSDYTELSGDMTEVQAEVATKANADGVAENLTSGQTKQLLSDKYTEDSEPYQFRTSGGSVDIGDREYDTIVGGTVCWNQLVENGNFSNTSDTAWTSAWTLSDNEATYTPPADGTYSANLARSKATIGGHRYMMLVDVKCEEATYVRSRYPWTSSGKDVGTIYSTIFFVGTSSADATNIGIQVSPKANKKISVKNFMLFDLTAMFGTTIADYIYSLETATAGAGVAFFKKLFPKDYYAYDAGTLRSVEGLSAHVTTGFNQWDEEWESGSINNQTGANDGSGTNRIRSKNYIPCLPNVSYCLSNGSNIISYLYFYDENKNFIGMGSNNNVNPRVDTTPSNCRFMRFRTNDNYGTTYKNDICINFHWDGERNGEYEEYVKHSYPLDDSLTLRGIMKLDAQNRLYFDGDRYESDGTVTRRFAVVDLGTLEWTLNNNSVWQTQTHPLKGGDYALGQTPVISQRYTPAAPVIGGNSDAYNRGNMTCCFYDITTTSGRFYIRDDSRVSLTSEEFKASLSGIYLVYEILTPTTETAEPFQSPQVVDDFGTEEYVTTSIVPVGHTTKYPENLRAKIEGLPWDFSTLIAPTEKTNTATRNYTTGALLILNNVLYKVTANIANGGTITPGTNVTATTLSEVILALA